MKIFNRQLIVTILVLAHLLVAMILIGPTETLDKKFFYTGDEARILFATFDHDVLRSYYANEIIDLAYLASYTMFFVLAFMNLNRRKFLVFALLPGFLDLIETGTILYALANPGPYPYFDWLGIVTALKWSSAGVAIVLFLVFFFARPRNENTIAE
jgi:hypothetical protein